MNFVYFVLTSRNSCSDWHDIDKMKSSWRVEKMKYWHWREQGQVWRHSEIHLSKKGNFWKLLIAWCYWDKIFAASQASVAPIPAERILAYWTSLRVLICTGRLQWVVEQKAADMTGWFAGAGHRSGLDEKGFISELKVLAHDNGKEMQSI